MQFTIAICAALILLFAGSTVSESLFGTTWVQKSIYQTKWFDLFLSLLWINIFCAALLRFPFKKQQISFFITHLGILGFLLGALLARLLSVEGQMILYEGESADFIHKFSTQLAASYPDQTSIPIPLKKGTYTLALSKENFMNQDSFCPLQADPAKKIPIAKKEHTASLTVLETVENASEELVYKENAESIVNRALKIYLESQQMNLKESFWLVERLPGDEQSSRVSMGPLSFVLETKKEEAVDGPVLIINGASEKDKIVIDLSQALPERIALAGQASFIINLKYLPYARVNGKELINAPDAGAPNPAVTFDIADEKGTVLEHRVKFAYFPEFEDMHGKPGQTNAASSIEFKAPAPQPIQTASTVKFLPASDGTWEYMTVRDKNESPAEKLELLKWISVGAMDLRFRVEEILTHAEPEIKMVSLSSDSGSLAVKVSLKDGQQEINRWIKEGQDTVLTTAQGSVRLGLSSKTQKMPFTLVLTDFRRIDYPGTQNPASYESDVRLYDPHAKISIERTVSMNNPLDYKGFRVFQSSYMQDDLKEGSIFTVAKNPGIPFIYFSSCTIFLGAFLQFYVKPFNKNGKKKENA